VIFDSRVILAVCPLGSMVTEAIQVQSFGFNFYGDPPRFNVHHMFNFHQFQDLQTMIDPKVNTICTSAN